MWQNAEERGHRGESSQQTTAVYVSWWWWWYHTSQSNPDKAEVLWCATSRR